MSAKAEAWLMVVFCVALAFVSFYVGALSERIDPEPIESEGVEICALPLPTREVQKY